jgi:uncharacterized protein
MHFVIHAVDRKDALPVRAKHYRDHRIHLDRAGDHGVSVMTAGTLVAEDGATPVGSLFILEAAARDAVDAFTRTRSTACGRPSTCTTTTRSGERVVPPPYTVIARLDRAIQ